MKGRRGGTIRKWVTLTATVSGGTVKPTGTVTFMEGTTALGGPRTLNASGVATLSISSLPAGAHSITAVYSGSADYNTSTSAVITQTVNQSPSGTMLTSSQATTPSQQPVIFTATVSGGTVKPTGTVTFMEGTTALGSSTLNASGVATLSIASLTLGTHSITAVYQGDANYLGSTSAPISQTIVNLFVNPASLAFYGTAGGAASTIPVSVGSPLSAGTWTATSDQPWLTASLTSSPAGGTIPLNLTADPGSLSAGLRTGTVTISSPGLNSVTISVTFSVANASLAMSSAAGSPVAVGSGPWAITTADLNGDGKLDLAVANRLSTSLTVLLGNGAGGFSAAMGSPYVGGGGLIAVAAGDLNGDGKLDLITDADTGVVRILLGQGNGQFTVSSPHTLIPSTGGGSGVVVRDFNNDDKPDLAVARYGGNAVTVALGDGNGDFTSVADFPVGGTPNGIAAGDFNGDGKLDLATADRTANTATVLLGLGDGTFQEAGGSPFAAGLTPWGVATGDFNRDGKPDLVVSNNASDNVTLLLGDGAGGFTKAAGSPFAVGNGPRMPAVADVNGDGKIDLAVPLGDGTTVAVLLGDGAGGLALSSISPLNVGSEPQMIAGGDFNGDGRWDLATANLVSNNVTVLLGASATTATAVTSSLPTSLYGQNVTFTATVTPVSSDVVPTGTVTFKDGSTSLGTGSAFNAAGQSTFTTSGLALGAHSITAVFAGDVNYNASTSSPKTQTVNKTSTSTTVTSSRNASSFGQTVVFTATVTPQYAGVAVPTGTVTFKEGAATLGTATLDASGKATFTPPSPLSINSHSITAVYAGDTNYTTSTSPVFSQIVRQASGTALVSSLNPSVFQQAVTFTATVAGASGTPTGTVTFRDTDGSIFGILNLSSGVATFTTSTLTAGTHTISAVYNGNSTYGPGDPAVVSQVVNQASTSTTLTSSLNPSTVGQSVTFTATVSSSGTPTGSVTFMDGATILGAGTLDAAGKATLSMSSLIAGTHSITALYSGDTNYATSTSAPLSQVVNKGSTSTALTSSVNPSAYLQSITLSVTVSSPSGTPTGSVTFLDGATILGAGILDAAGKATLSTSSLIGGTHSITALYSGDTNYATSTSAPLSQIVNKASTSTALTSSVNPSAYLQSITLTVTVSSPSGTPTGSVTFMDGAATLGTGTLDATGKATLSTSSLTIGAHPITALYAGDTNYLTSTSAVLSQVVGAASVTTTLTSLLNPSAYRQLVTFTATVSSPSGTPTGSVTFMDDAATLGTGTLSSGVAKFMTSALSVGSHSITAVYSGDQSYGSSTSGVLTQLVNTATAGVTLGSSTNPVTYGIGVVLTAKVTSASGPPTGTVTFFDGATPIGIGTLSAGTAVLTTAAYGGGSPLAAGAHAITAAYSGDANYAAATSAVLSQSVSKAAPVITWPTPLAIATGTHLSGTQLNATASFGGVSIPGTSLYTPAAGTVMNTTGSQPLSMTFTPADTANFNTVTANNAITVNGVASLTVARTLARDASGNIVVTLTITNAGGSPAPAVSINSLKIGTFNTTTPVPFSLGTIAAGTSASASFIVPGGAGASGAAGQLTFAGSYTGGTISYNGRITLP